MRQYPRNSPQAAAHIIALTVVADGDIDQPELDLLERLGAHDPLGLERHELKDVLDAFCKDVFSSQQLQWADVCPVDECTLAELVGEIEEPTLRIRLLRLCDAPAESEAHVAEGEQVVLAAAADRWGLHREMLRTTDQPPRALALK